MYPATLNDVFITAAELTQLRQLLAHDHDASAVAEAAICKPVREALRLPLHIPAPHACRYFDFYDLTTGQPLVWDVRSPRQHRSPSGKVFTGESYDHAWACIYHNQNANDARNCALAAAIFDDHDAAVRAHDLLMGYAKVYLEYPPIGRMTATWGRVTSSGLEEANWIIAMLWAAELLVKIGKLTSDELTTLRVKLFEPAADLLWGEWYFIHNIRMWHNAAIGSIGLAFGDRSLVRHAIYGPMGYRQQLIDGFCAEGLHVEGSPGYHAYGASAVVILAEAMARNGFEPYRETYLTRALLVSHRIAQPNGAAPALNDYGAVTHLPTRLYGTLLYRFDEPQVRTAAITAFTQWQQQNYRPDVTGVSWNNTTAYYARQQVDWLLAWPQLLQAKQQAQTKSLPYETVIDLRSSGVGIVRPASQDYLLLKCSRRGSGHDHHDKLSVIWWKNGRLWLNDIGTSSYSTPLHENWFKHTLSHHTVLVDGKAHERCDAYLTQCTERLIAGTARPYAQMMPDVQFTRQITIHPSGDLTDRFEVTCAKARTIDYVLRPEGDFVSDPEMIFSPASLLENEEGASLAYDPAYALLEDVRQIPADSNLKLHWKQGNETLMLHLSELPATAKVYLASAITDASDYTRRGQMVLVRTHASQATFVTQWSVSVASEEAMHEGAGQIQSLAASS